MIIVCDNMYHYLGLERERSLELELSKASTTILSLTSNVSILEDELKAANSNLVDFESKIISLVNGTKALNVLKGELESLYKLEQMSAEALRQQLHSRNEELEAVQKVTSSLVVKVQSLEGTIKASNERQEELEYVNELEKELECDVKGRKELGELEMFEMANSEQKASKRNQSLKEVQYLELSHNNPVIANKVARATSLPTLSPIAIPNTLSTTISTEAFDVLSGGVDTNISLNSLAESSASHETHSSRDIGEQRRCTRVINTLAVARTGVSAKGGPMISSIKQVPSNASKAPNVAF